MLRNYLLTAYRNLLRNKVYAILNILGLALGIGCSVVIYKVITYELSYDRHHSQFENIYRIVKEDIRPDRTDYGQGVPHPLGPALKEDFPDVLEVTRTFAVGGQITTMKDGAIDKKILMDNKIVFTEPAFFRMFDTDWLVGSKEEALNAPYQAIITAAGAKRLFDLERDEVEEAMGRVVSFDNEAKFEVRGIIEDFPESTNFPFEVFLEYYGQAESNLYFDDGVRWNSISSNTNAYFLTPDGFNVAQMEEQLIGFVDKYHGENASEREQYHVQPLADIHYSKRYDNYVNNTPKETLFAFGVIALFLILTACINFVNLATAQAANRSKEIGIRKAVGSRKSQIVLQFYLEIFIITFIACLLSLAIGELLFLYLEEILTRRLSLFPFTDAPTWLFMIGMLLGVTALAGFYPSILLSRMNTVMALKNKITSKNHSGGLSLRKGLVIFQFAISQFMIIGTLIITAQMNFFLNKELGFNRDAIINSYIPDPEETKLDRFRAELMSSASIDNVSFALGAPTANSNSHTNFNYEPLQSEDSYHGNFKCVDENYFELYGLELLAGREIRRNDSSSNVVVNRKVADLMGFKDRYEDAVGEKMDTGWGGDKQVIGVVENFHSNSLRSDLDYVFLVYDSRLFYSTGVQIKQNANFQAAIKHFEASWEQVFPEYVIDWVFYDEQLGNRYRTERSMASLMRLFSVIAIVIGCLGLYGLISFIAINKMKEIGIRKVLGASITNILGIFSKEVVFLLLIAFIVAAPGAYYLLNLWLEDFTFSITINPTFFLWSFLVTLLIALATISHRTISSALLNPAKTLKDE
ncbi:MAG: ABC transporter permease [Bacteroidota bacterium]